MVCHFQKLFLQNQMILEKCRYTYFAISGLGIPLENFFSIKYSFKSCRPLNTCKTKHSKCNKTFAPNLLLIFSKVGSCMPADFIKLDISGYQTPLWILPKKIKIWNSLPIYLINKM